ncbi:uncharacterized protein LOC118644906 [Monomorium pharaonis]|uniref:uncharacterized protein LOC118644906 n=1 Tax=Monomorium pharaonis TaxID=307658 RepID=UPI001746D8AB|nr:uncharacterized protein LOC118644906 [Monomorium pharaonis]
MYNLLPILFKLDTTDKNQQTSVILSSLIKNLPTFNKCTAKYLINEIEINRIDFNVLLKPTEFETFDYLTNIDLNTIPKSKINNEEMIGYDKYSNITQKSLGPVFVKLLYNLQTEKLPLSQELFGLLLINLPNPSNDPVLEENIRYLYDLTKNNVIKRNNWDSIRKDVPLDKDVYTIVFFVLTKILNSRVPIVIKDPAAYVYHHLKSTIVPAHDNSNKYMQQLTEKDLDIGMLLSAVIPQEFDQDAVQMKNRVLAYFMHNYRNEDVNKILKGFNKFIYSDPLDLLLAFLTRLTNRIPSFPNTNSQKLQDSATTLLSAAFVKKYSRIFTPFVSPEIDVLVLLESLRGLDMEATIQSAIDSIKLDLIAQPQISVLLSTLIPTEKDKCLIPKTCLINTFQQVHKLQNNIPLTLITKIQNVVPMLKQYIQPLSKMQSYSTQYSVKPPDINLYFERETPVAIAIKKDTDNVPLSSFVFSYVWNIDKYGNKSDLAIQDVSQVGNSEFQWQMGVPTYVDSTKMEIESTTINQAPVTETQVTEEQVTKRKIIEVVEPKVTETQSTETRESQESLPIQEHTSNQPLTLKPLLMTSIPDISSLITTYKPLITTQISRKDQPQHTTSRENIVEESQFSEDYTSENIPDIIYPDELPSQSYASEEIENETSPEEATSLVTTKKPIEITKKSIKIATKKPIKITTNKPIKITREKFIKMTTEKPIKMTTEKLIEMITEKPIEMTTKKSIKMATKKPIKMTTKKPIKMTTEKFIKMTAEKPIKMTTEKPIEMTTEKPIEMITENSIEMTTTRMVPKLLRKTDKKPDNEDVSSAIVLPPDIETDQLLRVHLSSNGVPVVTTDSDYNGTEPEIVLPEIKELLKPADINQLMQDTDSPIMKQVLLPLSVTLGKSVKKILKDVDTKLYPTNIALLSVILKKAATYPEVKKNKRLTNIINTYIDTTEYVSATILLPIIVSSKKLVSDVVYSTFNPNDLTQSKISETPPDKPLTNSITIPLVNPKLLLESVNTSDPYAGLLPTLEKESVFADAIQPLQMILASSKIVKILPNFKPVLYPNKGALLITLLYKLKKTKMIQSNPKLKSSINIYIEAIEIPSMSISVSEDSLVKMKSETTGQWQPELTSLITALPTPKNDDEIAMIEVIEQFLDDPTLLDKLHIAKPPATMIRGELLQKIIDSALSGTIDLEESTLKALNYYADKVEFTDIGALPIRWMWVETYVVKAEVQLGNMIQQTVNFDELTYKEKLAYNDLITYLAENPSLLQDNEDFDFGNYKTQGEFIEGLFEYLMNKPQVNDKIKKNIEIILPHVMQTGAGAVPMPSFSEF